MKKTAVFCVLLLLCVSIFPGCAVTQEKKDVSNRSPLEFEPIKKTAEKQESGGSDFGYAPGLIIGLSLITGGILGGMYCFDRAAKSSGYVEPLLYGAASGLCYAAGIILGGVAIYDAFW